MGFSLIIHHGGHFEVGENTGYNGGDIAVVDITDVDKWSYFEAVGIVRDIGYKEQFLLWWISESPAYVGGYKPFREDKDALNCAEFALLHNCEIHIYVESLSGEKIEGSTSGNGSNEEVESEVEDDADGVHFDDSEEERALGIDDGFQHEEPVESEHHNEEVAAKEKKGRTKVWSTHKAISPAKRAAQSLNEDLEYNGNELEEEYESEELYSTDTEEEDTMVNAMCLFCAI